MWPIFSPFLPVPATFGIPLPALSPPLSPSTQRLALPVPSRLPAKRRRRAEVWWTCREKTREEDDWEILSRKVVPIFTFPSLPTLAPAHHSLTINRTIRDDWGRVRRLAALLCVTQWRRCGIFPSDKRRYFSGNTSRSSKTIVKTRLVLFILFYKFCMQRAVMV